jgi:hypothetical protein
MTSKTRSSPSILIESPLRLAGEASVSLSLTWLSQWSFQQEDAHRFNGRLRRLGLDPAPPRFFPRGNLAKSVVQRALDRVERSVKPDSAAEA